MWSFLVLITISTSNNEISHIYCYLTGQADQIRRSSRSVCSNISEAWRKRRYQAAFICKLNDSESEASETQTWIEFSVKCGYISTEIGTELFKTYDKIIGKFVHPVKYIFYQILRLFIVKHFFIYPYSRVIRYLTG